MSFERRPHHKYAVDHRDDCKCAACRLWRKRHGAARVLDNLDEAERRVVGVTTKEDYTETPEAKERRIRRSNEIRDKIIGVIDAIMEHEDWPPSVRRKAEDQFATEAVRVAQRRSQEFAKIWAGKTFSERRRGAISSMQVLLGGHVPFRNRRGRLQEALGNSEWVLDIWQAALDEWEGSRQMRLL